MPYHDDRVMSCLAKPFESPKADNGIHFSSWNRAFHYNGGTYAEGQWTSRGRMFQALEFINYYRRIFGFSNVVAHDNWEALFPTDRLLWSDTDIYPGNSGSIVIDNKPGSLGLIGMLTLLLPLSPIENIREVIKTKYVTDSTVIIRVEAIIDELSRLLGPEAVQRIFNCLG